MKRRAPKILPAKRKATSEQIVSALAVHKGDQTLAARSLGVTPQAVQARIKKDPVVRSGWQRYLMSLEKVIPHTKSIRVISEGMDAMKDHRNDSGKIIDSSPDHQTRLKANEQYLKVSGLMKEDRPSGDDNRQFHLYLVQARDKTVAELRTHIEQELARNMGNMQEKPGLEEKSVDESE